jgi:NAD(P)-dependent dehydrogenase (short-subunit alcohol dehydrogenase family)
MPDQKVAVLTGPTSGIGRWIALGLARAGMRVVLIARNPARLEETRQWISTQVSGAVTEPVIADLSQLTQVRSAAKTIAAAHPTIAVLVNNAGVFSPRRTVTAEGHEFTLAVNHLAPFVLTRGLEPRLRAGFPSRIVNVGSAASDKVRLDLDDLQAERDFSLRYTYGRTKLALMMATFEWANRFESAAVTANVVHPGTVATDIVPPFSLPGLFWNVGKPFMLRPERGADTPLYVALTPELGTVTGKYFKPGSPVPRSRSFNPQAEDAAARARLWAETEKLVGPD